MECLQVWAADGLTIRNSRFPQLRGVRRLLAELPAGAATTPTNILIENNFMQCCGSGYFAIRLADHAGTQLAGRHDPEQLVRQGDQPDGGVPYTNVKIVNNIGPKLSFYSWAVGR